MNIKYVRTVCMLHTRGKSRIIVSIVFVRVLLRLFHDRNHIVKGIYVHLENYSVFGKDRIVLRSFVMHSVPDDKVNGS